MVERICWEFFDSREFETRPGRVSGGEQLCNESVNKLFIAGMHRTEGGPTNFGTQCFLLVQVCLAEREGCERKKGSTFGYAVGFYSLDTDLVARQISDARPVSAIIDHISAGKGKKRAWRI